MKKELNVVGTRVPMLDAALKAKGAALFTDDLVLPGMLLAKFCAVICPMPEFSI